MTSVITGATVPREALASATPANKRRYRSPARKFEGERKRAALMAAACALARKGNYRGTAKEIAKLAGERRQSICRYFGSVDILYRCVAREQWRAIAPALPLPELVLRTDWAKNAVWLILVGKPRDLSSEDLDGTRKDGAR